MKDDMSTKSDMFWSSDGPPLLAGMRIDAIRSDRPRSGGAVESVTAPICLDRRRRTDTLTLLIAQFKSPIILILLAAAILSYFLHDNTDAVIIIAIV